MMNSPISESPIPKQETLSLPQALQRAGMLCDQGRLVEAEHLYRQILRVRPDDFDVLHMLGAIKLRQRCHEEGVHILMAALRANPNSAEALSNLAYGLTELQRYEEAIASCDRALEIRPDSVEALFNRGNALGQLNRHEEAIASHERALEIKPNDSKVLCNLGAQLERLRRHEEAIDCCDRALAIKPDLVEALSIRGVALACLDRIEEAIASYDRALAIKPDYADVLHNRGLALVRLDCHEDAIASYDRALAIKPNLFEALYARGDVLKYLNRHEEAVASLDRALAIKPDFADALNCRGSALHELGLRAEAEASYRRVLEIEPDHVPARHNLGVLMRAAGGVEEEANPNLDAFLEKYISMGMNPTPVIYRGKNAIIRGWQKTRINRDNVRQYFNQKQLNIGIVLGDLSDGIIDVDIDDDDALRLAPWFLPKTDCVFGHGSRPASHWIYRVDSAGRREEFRLPSGKIIVEMRGNGNQTVFPGSVHLSDENIEFQNGGHDSHDNFAPASSTWDDLKRASARLAIATALYKHWAEAVRHDLTLHVADLLVRLGWSEQEIVDLIAAMAAAAQDEKADDRRASVRTACERNREGKPMSERSEAVARLGKGTVNAVMRWAELSVEPGRRAGQHR